MKYLGRNKLQDACSSEADRWSGYECVVRVSLVFLLTGNDSQVLNETNEVYIITQTLKSRGAPDNRLLVEIEFFYQRKLFCIKCILPSTCLLSYKNKGGFLFFKLNLFSLEKCICWLTLMCVWSVNHGGRGLEQIADGWVGRTCGHSAFFFGRFEKRSISLYHIWHEWIFFFVFLCEREEVLRISWVGYHVKSDCKQRSRTTAYGRWDPLKDKWKERKHKKLPSAQERREQGERRAGIKEPGIVQGTCPPHHLKNSLTSLGLGCTVILFPF